MSLQAVAQHMASQGRGPDTTLVHMAPREVAGLQALARAHGGSLTVNPQTGLPEAGFLSSILPMLAGAFLGPAGIGLFGSAATAGMGVGALTGLATGSLQKGLMAGIGAYGGAGLGGLISNAGAAAGQTVPMLGENMSHSFAGAPNITNIGGADLYADLATTNSGASGFGGMAPAAPAPDAGFLQSSAGTMQSGAPLGSSGSAGMDRFLGADGLTSQAVAPPATAMPAVAQPVAPRIAPPVAPVPSAPDFLAQGVDTPPPALTPTTPAVGQFDKFKAGIGALAKDPSSLLNKETLKYSLAAAAPILAQPPKTVNAPKDSEQYRYTYSAGRKKVPTREGDEGEYTYFEPSYTRLAAEGGTMTSDYTYNPQTMLYERTGGSSVTNPNYADTSDFAIDPDYAYTYDPVTGQYTKIAPKTPTTLPPAQRMIAGGGEGPSAAPSGPSYGPGSPDFMTDIGVPDYSANVSEAAEANVSPESTFASGGISHLGDYSDGGRLLRGPGDGVSDDIPAMIANKRPARLADGEFVVPARIVSELGNGSTEAGARKLYSMMDRIQKNRAKSVGKGRVAVNSHSEKMLPA